MMTRENVMRELELLPVWQLRTPLGKLDSPLVEAVATKMVFIENTPPAIATQNAAQFDYYQSENNTIIFIRAQEDMPATRIDAGLQSMLFDNILIALQMKAKKYDGNLAASGAKVAVAMGEETAQTLLNSTQKMDDLRGKTHNLQGLPLIVTYSPAEILEHLPNKAKTWHDLCIALGLVNA